jgi:hypothetical protein
MLETTAWRKRRRRSAWTAIELLLSVAFAAAGCASRSQTYEAQTIPRYSNGNMYCREYNYSPQLISLLPECKPDPPGSTVYQQATTVWTYNRLDSNLPPASRNPDPNR